MLNLIAMIGSHILSLGAGLMAAAMISYSGYVIYDSVTTEQAAFSSWDLEQYKPVALEEGEDLSLEDLYKMNSDAVGWITVPYTHIDYPLVQGHDDLEYSFRDVHGKTSLTGSIYLSCQNDKKLGDSYNLIYGHHMENGAMFGDIEKYEDGEFFDEHKLGVIVTNERAYDLHMFAYVLADAYDGNIYSIGDRSNEDMEGFLSYIKENAYHWEDGFEISDLRDGIAKFHEVKAQNVEENGEFDPKLMPTDPGDYGIQIVAMSTCQSAATNGRQILFATMTPRTEPLPIVMINDGSIPLSDGSEFLVQVRSALAENPLVQGHGQAETWSLVNLLTLLLMIYITIPVFGLWSKFGRVWMMYKANKRGKTLGDAHGRIYHPRSLLIRNLIGLAIEAAATYGALRWFFLRENILTSMTIVDENTPTLLLWAVGVILADILFFRYEFRKPFYKFGNKRKAPAEAGA